MRPYAIVTAAGLWLAPLLGLAAVQGAELTGGGARPVPAPQPIPAAKEDDSCGKYGTAIAFVANPSQAAKMAKREEKLVLVLHLSGIFEDPKLT